MDGTTVVVRNTERLTEDVRKQMIVEYMERNGMERSGHEEVAPLFETMESLGFHYVDTPDRPTTAARVDLTGVREDSPIHELVRKLNCRTNWDHPYPEDSVMVYETLCTHDEGHLCEHRLQFIVDFIREHYESEPTYRARNPR